MKLSDFSYILPKHKVAQHPPKKRGNAKLLVLDKNSGELADKRYTDCIDYFSPGDVVILNNTKVIKARLFALGEDRAEHELILLETHKSDQDKFHHKALYRGKLINGENLSVGEINLKVVGRYEEGIALLESDIEFEKIEAKHGMVPLPPYMKRDANKQDALRYQTEFAKYNGSVAAPTASLNMTNNLIKQLQAKGVRVCYLTLHVGLGTFLPIRVGNSKQHKMHSEWFEIPAQTIQAILRAKSSENKIFAIGTTVARTLEYSATVILSESEESGSTILNTGQDPSDKPQDDKKQAFSSSRDSISGEADIFIYPGYQFKIVDSLLTNFHAPKSTVLMLAAAFSGWENLQTAYHHALKSHYKFLSYGDSMLIV